MSDQTSHRILIHFNFDHLRLELAMVSKQFWHLANELDNILENGPEKSVALRKLLEAKDAAVRAKVHPGG